MSMSIEVKLVVTDQSSGNVTQEAFYAERDVSIEKTRFLQAEIADLLKRRIDMEIEQKGPFVEDEPARQEVNQSAEPRTEESEGPGRRSI